jgi:exosortase
MSRFEIVLVAAMGVVWIPGLLALAEVWNEVEYASHGFLVPFVALWAATAHRQRLAELAPRPVRGGLYWIGLSLVAYLIALIVGSATLIGLVLVIGVGVVVIGLRGIEWMRTLTFPLAYLLFMVPLPSSWVTPLIVRLQMLVSGLAVWILQAVGVPIYRSGNVLELPGGATLFVAEACSGITSLITLIPIGVFIAYFTESRLLRRLILVAAVVPIALVGNLLRVILTVEVAVWGDVEMAIEGPLHEWAGVATYVLGCLCLLAVGALMRRLWPETSRLIESSAS